MLIFRWFRWTFIWSKFGINWTKLLRSILSIHVKAIIFIIIRIFLTFVIPLNIFLFISWFFLSRLLLLLFEGSFINAVTIFLRKLLLFYLFNLFFFQFLLLSRWKVFRIKDMPIDPLMNDELSFLDCHIVGDSNRGIVQDTEKDKFWV